MLASLSEQLTRSRLLYSNTQSVMHNITARSNTLLYFLPLSVSLPRLIHPVPSTPRRRSFLKKPTPCPLSSRHPDTFRRTHATPRRGGRVWHHKVCNNFLHLIPVSEHRPVSDIMFATLEETRTPSRCELDDVLQALALRDGESGWMDDAEHSWPPKVSCNTASLYCALGTPPTTTRNWS